MTRIEVRVTKNNLPRLQAIDWTGIHARIGAYMIREMAEMFSTTGASRGHKWQELAPSTLISKFKQGRSTEILQRSGLLRASFRPLRMNQDELIFGTDVPYAKYHDSDRPRQQKVGGGPRLPQRKLLRITNRDVETYKRLIVDAIHAAAKGEA